MSLNKTIKNLKNELITQLEKEIFIETKSLSGNKDSLYNKNKTHEHLMSMGEKLFGRCKKN